MGRPSATAAQGSGGVRRGQGRAGRTTRAPDVEMNDPGRACVPGYGRAGFPETERPL